MSSKEQHQIREIPTPSVGGILTEEFLEPLGITPYRLAKDVHMALRLSRYLGTSERFWLNLQNNIDILVMDMDWHRRDGTTGFGWCNRGAMGWTGWSWNRELLPDVEVLLDELRNDHIYETLNAQPHDGIRSSEDMNDAFMRDLGYDPDERKDLPFLAGDRAYMEAYFKHAHQPHEEMGVDFWWVDWQQDSIMPFVYHVLYLRHLPWLNHLYFRNSQKLGRRGLGFSRWAGWGSPLSDSLRGRHGGELGRACV